MSESHHSRDWLGLAGRIFAVSGAASGIGEAIATALAQQGANVALLDRNPEGCEEVKQRLATYPGRRLVVACDVSSESTNQRGGVERTRKTGAVLRAGERRRDFAPGGACGRLALSNGKLNWR
ncbi:SDR family oxidoreductase [Pseudocitrobacter faecalis]|nr:SDR family oxidoreductase [Pseudocitrobacter faecalis]